MALLTKKEITISRLELLSNLMASIFIKYIRNQHRIDHKAHIWTDSQITTSWITAANKTPRRSEILAQRSISAKGHRTWLTFSHEAENGKMLTGRLINRLLLWIALT
jgi:hypothetical protein